MQVHTRQTERMVYLWRQSSEKSAWQRDVGLQGGGWVTAVTRPQLRKPASGLDALVMLGDTPFPAGRPSHAEKGHSLVLLGDTPLPWAHFVKAVIHGQSPTMHLLGHSSTSHPPQSWQTPNHRPSGVVCSSWSVKTEHFSSLGPHFSSARPPAKEWNPAPSKELPAEDSSRLTSVQPLLGIYCSHCRRKRWSFLQRLS